MAHLERRAAQRSNCVSCLTAWLSCAFLALMGSKRVIHRGWGLVRIRIWARLWSLEFTLWHGALRACFIKQLKHRWRRLLRHGSKKEICISFGKIHISFFHLYKSGSEIHISLGKIHISLGKIHISLREIYISLEELANSFSQLANSSRKLVMV